MQTGIPNIGIFSRAIAQKDIVHLKALLEALAQHHLHVVFYAPLLTNLRAYNLALDYPTFNDHSSLVAQADILISLGGDGTFLQTIPLIRDNHIPVVGLNLGTLGFLASIEPQYVRDAVHHLVSGRYYIENRNLLSLVQPQFDLVYPFALNDVTLFKAPEATMLHLEVFIDDSLLYRYYGDGLILSTATGSTAYNLSCGGPILVPNAAAFVLTPIASHALTTRPVVIADTSVIKIVPYAETYHLTVDSNKLTVKSPNPILLCKAPFTVQTIHFDPTMDNEPQRKSNFFHTLQQKLMWGQHGRK
ncbi:NAD kinase [Bacteroidia bacterium]|nr:NAD kinase [Bacteroidia bacterium]